MSKGISMFRISSLSAQNEYKSLIERERNLNLKFMEILKNMVSRYIKEHLSQKY